MLRSRRWTTLAVGSVAQGAFAAVFFGVAVLAPTLRDRLDLSLPQVGLMIACVDIGGAATLIGWGVLTDRFGERVVIASGLGLAALCLVATSQAGSFPVLVAALVAAGAFGSCVYTATGRAVVAAFPPRQRGRALAIRHTANPLAGALVAVVLPRLTRPGDVSRPLLALALGLAAAAVTAGALLRGTPAGPAAAARSGHVGRDRRVWRLSGGSGLIFLAQGSLLAFFVVFLHDVHHVDVRRAGLVLAAVQVTGGALRLAAGWWSDRSGSRIGPLLRIAAGLSLALLLTAATADSRLALVLAPLAVAGALSLSWNALSYTAAAELGGARAGTALGIQQTALSLGSMSAPVVFALIVAAAGWTTAFAVAGVAAATGAFVLRGLRGPAPSRA